MIRIIRGVYGHYVTDQKGNTRVVAGEKNSDPFELPPEQEARLVRVGVAEYVAGKAVEDKPAVDPADDLPDGVDAIPEYNVGMKADELRKIAKLMGLTFAVGTTKAEMVVRWTHSWMSTWRIPRTTPTCRRRTVRTRPRLTLLRRCCNGLQGHGCG